MVLLLNCLTKKSIFMSFQKSQWEINKFVLHKRIIFLLRQQYIIELKCCPLLSYFAKMAQHRRLQGCIRQSSKQVLLPEAEMRPQQDTASRHAMHFWVQDRVAMLFVPHVQRFHQSINKRMKVWDLIPRMVHALDVGSFQFHRCHKRYGGGGKGANRIEYACCWANSMINIMQILAVASSSRWLTMCSWF